MSNPKCPFCNGEMTVGTPFYDKHSGKYSSQAKCWKCGAQGPLAKSGSSSIVKNRALKSVLNRPLRRALQYRQLETFPVVYLEDKDKKDVLPAFPEPVHDRGVMCFLTAEQEFITAQKADYGKRWRAWPAMPTKEERSAQKWM